VERSYTYDDDDRVIRRLTQAGNSKEDESKTYNFKEDESKMYNAQGDEDWTLKIRSGSDDQREEFRYLYQYDSHGNWTERTTINTDQAGRSEHSAKHAFILRFFVTSMNLRIGCVAS
jgi:hypothetical protein